MLSPAARAALEDLDLRGGLAYQVYFHLYDSLCCEHLVEVKHAYLARRLHCSRRHLVDVMQLLVRKGYLEHQGRPGAIGKYRLRYRRL